MGRSEQEQREVEKFKTDLAKFSGQYLEYLVIVKSASGLLHWKSTDKCWAIGAAQRYLSCVDEWDRIEEQESRKNE